jgi:hypothetical protein
MQREKRTFLLLRNTQFAPLSHIETGEPMQTFVIHRQHGTAIAFILMALIAILAIVVVLLSRARRENKHLIQPPPAEAVTTGTTSARQDFATSAPAQSVLPSTSTGFQGEVPPPPPPLAPTPDHRDLPPEG